MAYPFTDGTFVSEPFALLYTYDASTLVARATYTTHELDVENENPVQCDVAGRARVWLGPYVYRIVCKTSDGVTLWDEDGISSDGTAIANIANESSAVQGAQLIGYNPALAYTDGLGQFLNYFFGRTVAELAAAITPTNYAFREGDFRRYGGIAGASNNAVAINAALLVSANSGDAAFIPPGTWAHTAALAATLSCCMYGVGPASVLNPVSCDGLVFTNQTSYQGGRFFRDFSLIGTTTEAKAAIKGSMTAASGNRVTGINFSGLNVQGFQYAIDIQGFWNCRWRECFLYNNYQGVRLTERNINSIFADCLIQKGTLTGAGDQYGFLTDQVGGVRSESITLRGCFIYGWDYGVGLGNVLYSIIDQCDIDNTQITGVVLTTVNGGATVRDCWINTTNGVLTKGIDVSALGAANHDKITLDGNTISCTTAFAGSIGVLVGDNQNGGVSVTNNRVTGFETGIKSASADNCRIKWNSINATATAVLIDSLGADNEVGPNYIQGGTALAFTSANITPPGFSYYARGSFTITLTGMTGATTGTVNWVANGREVRISIATAGIVGTSDTTTGTAMTGTGLPAYLSPVTDQSFMATVIDVGVASYSTAVVAAATGVITFKKDANGTVFTNSGTKGLGAQSSGWAYL